MVPHQTVGLTSLQGDHIRFFGHEIVILSSQEVSNSGSLATPSTFVYFPCRCALFLMDYTNAGGNVHQGGGGEGSKSIGAEMMFFFRKL